MKVWEREGKTAKDHGQASNPGHCCKDLVLMGAAVGQEVERVGWR